MICCFWRCSLIAVLFEPPTAKQSYYCSIDQKTSVHTQKSSSSPGKSYKNTLLSHQKCCTGDGVVRSASFVICRVMNMRCTLFSLRLVGTNTFQCTDHMAMQLEMAVQFCVDWCWGTVSFVPIFWQWVCCLIHVWSNSLAKWSPLSKGTCLDHIWSKSAVRQSPMMRGTLLDHIWLKSTAWQSPPTRGTVWTTFGQSPQ